jgi:hypothetical protein
VSGGGFDQPFDPFRVAETEKSAPPPDGAFHEIDLPSGARLSVPTLEEAQYLQRMVDGYREDYQLTNVSDIGELDRCITLELQMHRCQVWLIRRTDYDNTKVDENAMMQRTRELSAEIRQVKKTLGVDRVARERQSGKGSVFEYITSILERARRFGLMRNAQMARAIELANKLISLRTAQKNCTTDKELKLLAVTDADIMEWIDQVFTPEFQAIDEAYREGDQKMWILANA